MTILTVDDGTVVELGAVLAKAGEGTIYEVGDRTDVVAKVFHDTLSDRAEKLDKVAAMVKTTPPGAVQSDGFVVLAWPQHRVLRVGRPTGYLMPRVDAKSAVEIHALSNPFNRANPLKGAPQWTANATWAHLINVAANLCLAVDVVHRVDAVIGDFQERNVLVSDTTRVTLVDCDSMQFIDADGRQFLCAVARPEFAAPELADINLRSQPRHASSDLFALAVHIYQLLLGGNHPFMRGVWTGAGDQPHALELAKTGCWAGGPGSPLATHPLAPPVSFLPADLVCFFERAFTDGARDPALRPSAADWRRALINVRTGSCRRGAHDIPVDASACPWCAIDDERARRKRRTAASQPENIEPQVISDIPEPSRRTSTTAPTSARTLRKSSNNAMPSASRRTSAARNRVRRLAVSHSAKAVITALLLVLFVANYVSGSGGTTLNLHLLPSTRPLKADGPHPVQFLPLPSASAPAPPPATPPPDDSRSATAEAIKHAGVGDCIHRESGAQKSDGSAEVTVRASTCWSSDATDEVAMRTNDASKCTTHAWVSTTGVDPPVVLCLDEP